MVATMDRGLYTAATGMLAEMDRMNAISNNLANLSTPGYKSDYIDQGTFARLLWSNRGNGQNIGTWDIGPGTEAVVSLSQGAITPTTSQLDLAINGEGFFAVRTPQGVRYTRNGSFARNADGELVTSQGYQVLGANGQPLRVGGGDFRVSPEGFVTVGDQQVGQIAVFNLNNPQKIDGSLWNGQPAGRPAETLVVQSALESSNVNSIQQVTDMIVSQRAFDSGQRVLRAIDDSLQLAARVASVQ